MVHWKELFQQKQWTELLRLLHSSPHLILNDDDSMDDIFPCCTPLEVAVRFLEEVPVALVQELVGLRPDYCQRKSPFKQSIPLHDACHPMLDGIKPIQITNDSNGRKIISLVMEAYPKGIWIGLKEKDHATTALHVLLQHRPPLDLVREMVEASRGYGGDILDTLDGQKQNPLHVALQYHASDDVIKYLIREGGEAILDRAGAGDMKALHTAVYCGCTPEVFRYLLKKDDTGRILDTGNKKKRGKRKTTSVDSPLLLALHKDNWEKWSRHYEPQGRTVEGTTEHEILSGNVTTVVVKVIEGPPKTLMLPSEMVLEMVETFRRNTSRSFCPPKPGRGGGADPKVSAKADSIAATKCKPVLRAAKQCRRTLGTDAVDDLDKLVDTLERYITTHT